MYWHYIEARIEYVSANLAVTRVQASYLYNLPKTVSWILKQPLKHFNIPKNQHDDKMLSVIEQCKL
jgi:peptide/nickel transport system ATP-binding protein